jgi:hypothetical protein
MVKRSTSLVAALLIASLVAPQGAWAQGTPAAPAASATPPAPTSDQIAKAKTLFDLGAKAYEAENFPAAIQAFLEAYRLSQRPGPIFSAAQSYRRLYTTDRKVDTLRQAIAYYRLYVEKQKAGGRIAEAQQALRDLDVVLATVGASAPAEAPATAPAPADAKPKTTLMVSSATKGAMASVDGGEMSELPLFHELTPGDHTLRVAAEGFFDDERTIAAGDAGGLAALDVTLREKPASLTIKTDGGAAISIDGRNEGTSPLPRPLQLPSGEHLVTITKNGYRPFSAELDLRRDERRPLEVDLVRTAQREASFGVIGVAGAGFVAGAIVTGFALDAQARAVEIEALKDLGDITPALRDEHEAASRSREELRGAAAITFSGAALLALVGVGLYVFDRPSSAVPVKLRDSKPPEAKRPPKVNASVAPFLGPQGGGAILQLQL